MTTLGRGSGLSSPRARARPRASSFTSPSGAIMMFDGEVDLAHAALAEAAEDPVAAQEEALGHAGQQLVGLVVGERAAVDQESGEARGGVAGRLGGEARPGAGEGLGSDQAAAGDVGE